MSDKKYYWLKLKEDFFEEDTISWIEEQQNGKDYSLFYLKLCLKSLKTDGILVRNVGQVLIPYDAKKLSQLTNTDVDTVLVAMELFKQIGLVQILDNGEIYMTQLESMVGAETKWAEKKRLQRQNIITEDIVPKLSGHCPTEIEIEKELDIEKEKEKELDIEKEKKKDKELEIEKHFSSFWSIYPKKTDKKKALKIFKTALKNHPIETILSGTESYAVHIKQSKIESQYIKHATTFLNNESFLNEYETKKEVDALGYDISQYKDIF